jgi:hypothetical protein
MPAKERSYPIDARTTGIDQSHNQRQHREAMVGNKPPQALNQRVDDQHSQWDDAGWDQDPDEAGHRARRLLTRSGLAASVRDRAAALCRWLARERWVQRLAIGVAVLLVIFADASAHCGGGWALVRSI